MAKTRKTSRINPDEQVARYLGRQHLEVCPDTGKILGILWQGFALRTANSERELSVNHLQHFSGDMAQQMNAIKQDVGGLRQLGATSAFAVVEVGNVTDCGQRNSMSIHTFKKPEAGNPSHAEVRGLPVDNSRADVLQELADIAFRKMFLTKDI